MAKLILKFKDTTIEEIPITKSSITVGREPSNDVVIDNLSVSRHHFKISEDNHHYIVEDLNSGNGTFVNDKQVVKDALRNQDEIQVGKHTLIFVNEERFLLEEHKPAAPSLAEETFILDAKTQEELMALRRRSNNTPTAQPQGAEPAAELEGQLTILAGAAPQDPIQINKRTFSGGKRQTADLTLKGMFIGATAFIINKKPDGFFIVHSEGMRRTKVNGDVVKGQRKLQDGDIIAVGSTKMQFRTKKPSANNA